MAKKVNWNKTLWHHAVVRLPGGLSVRAVSERLGKPIDITRMWLKTFRYSTPDGRGLWRRGGFFPKSRKLDPDKVNWKLRDVDIAREFKVSRERVRQVRKTRRFRK